MRDQNFDYLRLFLAVTVMTGHVGLPTLQFGALWNSHLAVYFFFALSGFLIARSFLASSSVSRYAEKRFRRIYPPIAAMVVVLLVFGMVTGLGSDHARSVASLLWFQDWLVLAAEGKPIFAHGAFWTLVVEAQFYIALPALLIFWRSMPRLGIAAIVALYAIAYAVHLPARADVLDMAFRNNLLTFAHYFLAGTLAALIAPNAVERRWFWLGALPVAIAAFILPEGFYTPLAVIVLVLAIGRASYLATAFLPSPDKAPWGDISYGVYLYHFPVLFMLDTLGISTPNRVMATTLVLSLLSWHLLEKPLLKRPRLANRVGNIDGQVRSGAKVGSDVFEVPVIDAEQVNIRRPLKDTR